MGKSSKAPKYATTTFDTGGLFGSSTNSKSGTTYTANEPLKTAGNSAWGGLNQTLSSMLSNDYTNDPNYRVYQNDLYRQMTDNFDNNVLSQLANRGLMRSSGLQAATNAFNDTLANQTANLYDSYYNRLGNNLNSYQNTLNSLYNYITGINSGALNTSNAVNKHNMDAYTANQNANTALFTTLANAGSNIAGSYLGGKK